MIVYLIVASIPFLVGEWFFCNVKRTGKLYKLKKLLCLLLAALPMFLLIGFRNQYIGADTINYLNHFTQISQTPWGEIFEGTRMEYGYIVFVKLISLFTKSPLVYQVICAMIYWVAISVFANQLEDSSFLFFYFFATLGIYTFMYTGVRQCIAMCICLLSYVFIRKRKIIPFILLVILAYFFHKSSILFVATYFIYNRKITWYNMLIYGGISAFSVYYLENIQQFFNDALDYDYTIENAGGGTIFLVLIAGLTLMSILIIFSYNKLTKQGQGLFNIGVIAVFFWILRYFTRVAERPSFFFLFFSCALLAHALDLIPKAKERFFTKCAVCAVTLALYVYRFSSNFSTYVPWQSYSF